MKRRTGRWRVRYLVRRGKGRLFYWRAIGRNGRGRSDGSEGYSRDRDCWRALLKLLDDTAGPVWRLGAVLDEDKRIATCYGTEVA